MRGRWNPSLAVWVELRHWFGRLDGIKRLSMRLWQKALHREEWQRWYAWHPVKAGGGLVWLEWIERRRCYAVIDEWWEVRLPDRKEAGQKLVAHRTRSERCQTLAPKTLAVYAENRLH